MIKTLKWIKLGKNHYCSDWTDIIYLNDKLLVDVLISKLKSKDKLFKILISVNNLGAGNFLKIDYSKDLKSAKNLTIYYLNMMGVYKK